MKTHRLQSLTSFMVLKTFSLYLFVDLLLPCLSLLLMEYAAAKNCSYLNAH